MSLLKFSILLTSILLLVTISSNAQIVCDEIIESQDYQLSVIPTYGLPGDTVLVPVYLKTIDTSQIFYFYINYDHDNLTPVSIPGYPEYVESNQIGRFIGAPGFAVYQSSLPDDSGCLIAFFDPLLNNFRIQPGEGIIFEMAFIIDDFFPYSDSAKFWFQESQSEYDCRRSVLAISNPTYPGGIGTIYPETFESYFYYDMTQQAEPIIFDFYSQPRSIVSGDPAYLIWNFSINFDSAKISNGVGNIYSNSSDLSVTPTVTTTYTLTAYNSYGFSTASLTVNVTQPGENQYPCLVSVTDQQVYGGNVLQFSVWATDPDGTIPYITTSPLPGTATFSNNTYPGIFYWLTGEDDVGTHHITFYAADGVDPGMIDSLSMEITVLDANFPPQWDFDLSVDTLFENDTLQFLVEFWDPDSTIPIMEGHLAGDDTLATNMIVLDSGNGKAVFTFTPDSFQGNRNPFNYYVRFTFYDSENSAISVETPSKLIRVYNENSGMETPNLTLSVSGPFAITGGTTLEFDLYASNTNGDLPVVTSSPLPEYSSLVHMTDSVNSAHHQFHYTPLPSTDSTFEMTFYANTEGLVDSETVIISVTKANNVPWIFVNTYQQDSVTEGSILHTMVQAFDADSVFPLLDAFLDGRDTLATNMSFYDSGNGVGILTFSPNQIQGNAPVPKFYYVRFSAQDPVYLDVVNLSYTWTIKVFDSGQPCCIGVKGDVDYNSNGNDLNVADIVFLVNYVIKGQGVIPCFGEADIDQSGTLNMSDIIILVDYLFKGGSIPNCQ
ncbi:MAG: hypothetical protein ABIJ12_05000 [bacterium]